LSNYDKLANDTCWRQLILANWGRANRYWNQMKMENVALVGSDGEVGGSLRSRRSAVGARLAPLTLPVARSLHQQ